MVHFRVIADDHVYLFGIDYFCYITNELITIILLDGVDERNFLIHDQKCVITGAAIG